MYLFILELTIYFLRTIGVSGFSATPYLRIVTITVILIILIKYFMSLKITLKIQKQISSENKFVLFWVIATFLSFLFGLIFENSKIYLLTDFLYIIYGFMLYNIITFLIKKYYASQGLLVVNFTYYNLFVMFLVVFALFLNGKINPQATIFLISWIFILLTYNKYMQVLLLLPLFLVTLSSRADLVSLIFIIFLTLINKSNNKRKIIKKFYKFLIFVFSPLFLVILFYFIYSYLPHNHPISLRITQFILLFSGDYNNAEMISLLQRINEAKAVTNQWLSDGVHFIFGSGLGATISGKDMIDDSVTNASLIGGDNIHNIHILPFALIHKYGLLGIVIFLMLIQIFFKSISVVTSKDFKKYPILYNFGNIFFISIFLYALPASSYLWTTPMFWMVLALKDSNLWRLR